MSWYATIYTRVRVYRKDHPCRGWLLSRCLNLLLILQFAGHLLSLYVYIWHICGVFIPSPVQAVIYLCVYLSLSLMGVWSLLTTIMWPVRKVSSGWNVGQKRMEELQKITPMEGDRYVIDKSTPEQTAQQHKVLKEVAQELGCHQAECDQAGRPKICFQCGHLKPDRTHHCSSCGFCVVHFDHHCPWINHCVNHSNYKFFLLYLVYAVGIILWFLLGAIESIIRFLVKADWAAEWPSLLGVMAVLIPFAIFGYFPLGELLIYHWGLISINETTCEQAKPAVLSNDFAADYNLGRWNNIRQVFGWGLWLFPLPTSEEDGLHFVIRYVECPKTLRLRRVEVGSMATGKTKSSTPTASAEKNKSPAVAASAEKTPVPTTSDTTTGGTQTSGTTTKQTTTTQKEDSAGQKSQKMSKSDGEMMTAKE